MPKLFADYELKEVDGGWEYEVTLWRGQTVVDILDSEMQNNPQPHALTYRDAENAAKEIVLDVKRGKAEFWFTEVTCGAKT